mmetsp:Transcript_68609/g.189897  ORF Transcript_68609/g.189897 Transcript_68609/m.189897 type:complete len:251 (+) Transcript_68609:663-1415(+)
MSSNGAAPQEEGHRPHHGASGPPAQRIRQGRHLGAKGAPHPRHGLGWSRQGVQFGRPRSGGGGVRGGLQLREGGAGGGVAEPRFPRARPWGGRAVHHAHRPGFGECKQGAERDRAQGDERGRGAALRAGLPPSRLFAGGIPGPPGLPGLQLEVRGAGGGAPLQGRRHPEAAAARVCGGPAQRPAQRRVGHSATGGLDHRRDALPADEEPLEQGDRHGARSRLLRLLEPRERAGVPGCGQGALPAGRQLAH